MELRAALPEDLSDLKELYRAIVAHMEQAQLQIWDEIYPCEFLQSDIEAGRLYVLEEHTELLSAFALCGSNAGADAVTWKSKHGKALYLDRLGVHVDHLRKGLGSLALRRAMALAREQGAEWLRLFVVDVNRPAIRLYLKNGFEQAGGVYEEHLDGGAVLRELGFEIPLSV